MKIGNGVTSIEPLAFGECISLPSIIIPSSVAEIKGGAFYGCEGLTDYYVYADEVIIEHEFIDNIDYGFRHYPTFELKAKTTFYTVTDSKGAKLVLTITVTDPARLSEAELSVQVGKSGKLTVSDLYGRAVTWSSGNPAVATVKNGVVTGVKAGKCAVTAKVAKGRTLQCAVTVAQ